MDKRKIKKDAKKSTIEQLNYDIGIILTHLCKYPEEQNNKNLYWSLKTLETELERKEKKKQ